MRIAYFLFVALFFDSANAAVSIPRRLSASDREQVVRILGWGTSGKILADPYPLGGYPGLELSLSIESVPVDDLSSLGARTDQQENFTYPKITIGKGLYNNIDTWIHFIPYSEGTGLSEYGALMRWCFFQAKFFPGTFSLVAHGNSTNVANAFTSQAYGLDLITGINISNIALFLGGGKIAATGRFQGGNTDLSYTDSCHLKTHGDTSSGIICDPESATAEGFHAIIGGSIRIDTLLAVLQIDLYSQPVISSKIGFNF